MVMTPVVLISDWGPGCQVQGRGELDAPTSSWRELKERSPPMPPLAMGRALGLRWRILRYYSYRVDAWGTLGSLSERRYDAISTWRLLCTSRTAMEGSDDGSKRSGQPARALVKRRTFRCRRSQPLASRALTVRRETWN